MLYLQCLMCLVVVNINRSHNISAKKDETSRIPSIKPGKKVEVFQVFSLSTCKRLFSETPCRRNRMKGQGIRDTYMNH